jgi:hypothetical protein
MAEDEDPNIIKKAEADKGNIEAEENVPDTDPEVNLRAAEENLRVEAGKIVNKDEESGDTIPQEMRVEQEATRVNKNQSTPEKVEKRFGQTSISGILRRRPIIIVLAIGIITLGVFLLYSVIQLNNESYKAENYNVFWNQSLADLKGGNITMDEYCTNRVHDEQFCNQFASLQYMH